MSQDFDALCTMTEDLTKYPVKLCPFIKATKLMRVKFCFPQELNLEL